MPESFNVNESEEYLSLQVESWDVTQSAASESWQADTGDAVYELDVQSSQFAVTVVENDEHVFSRPAEEVLVVNVGPVGPAGTSTVSTYDQTNKSGSTLTRGQVVATHSSGSGVILADATTGGKLAIGLMYQDLLSLDVGPVQVSGPMTIADWTAITGGVNLLPKAVYYLDTTAGMLSTASPTSSPNISQRVGFAMTDDTLMINIWQHVIL